MGEGKPLVTLYPQLLTKCNTCGHYWALVVYLCVYNMETLRGFCVVTAQTNKTNFISLWFSDIVWWCTSESAVAQVMAHHLFCCSLWWCHQMETLSALLALCEGNPPVIGGFPSQRPVTWSCDVFFDLRLNKHLCKHSRRWWFETPSWSLWRHRNDKLIPMLRCRHSPQTFVNLIIRINFYICFPWGRIDGPDL